MNGKAPSGVDYITVDRLIEHACSPQVWHKLNIVQSCK